MYKPSKQTFIMEDIQEKYNHLLQQNEALRQENEELESLLHAHGIEYKPKHAEEKDAVYSPFTFPYVKLSIEERVAIFHSLFKGREDVFAQRWFSKTTGKSGYQPVCINEWRRGVCDKKKYKCADCPNRHFTPLTYQDLYRHLEGKDENCCDVVGLYALMPEGGFGNLVALPLQGQARKRRNSVFVDDDFPIASKSTTCSFNFA